MRWCLGGGGKPPDKRFSVYEEAKRLFENASNDLDPEVRLSDPRGGFGPDV